MRLRRVYKARMRRRPGRYPRHRPTTKQRAALLMQASAGFAASAAAFGAAAVKAGDK